MIGKESGLRQLTVQVFGEFDLSTKEMKSEMNENEKKKRFQKITKTSWKKLITA